MIKLKDYQPSSLEEAVDLLMKDMTEEEITFLKEHSAVTCHHTVGQEIRNEWGLWRGSPLSLHFKKRFGLGHADDMSGLILSLIDLRMKNPNATADELTSEVERYKNHWKMMGVDPLTQKPI
jgi:hypothetical protein